MAEIPEYRHWTPHSSVTGREPNCPGCIFEAGREAAAADLVAAGLTSHPENARPLLQAISYREAARLARGDNPEPCNDCKAGDHFACQQEGPDPNYCGCYRRGHGEQR